jgi:guanylate kinase
VLCGPGGVGKGTLARRLVEVDDRLWLSRSWTTRPRRPSEADDSYVFVDEEHFRRRIDEGGFLEWAEFQDHLYGTPLPELPEGRDLLLEIDVQGAEQIRRRFPDARCILVRAPDEQSACERMRERGDDEAHVRRRLESAASEVERAQRICDAEVVNDVLDRAVGEVLERIASWRAADGRSGSSPEPGSASSHPERGSACPNTAAR